MNNILIHIGFHKTGSTWLQKELFRQHYEVFEMLSKKVWNEENLALHFVKNEEGYLLSSFSKNTQSIKKELANRLAKRKNIVKKTMVISSERLSGNPHSGGFDAKLIAHRIKAAIPDAKILIVLREQNSFLTSNYFQYLSQGGILNIDKYLNTKNDHRTPFFAPHHIDYAPLITKYQQLFSAKQVLVLPYEMFKNRPQLFIKKIGDFIENKITVSSEKFKVIHNSKQYYFVKYYFRWIKLFTHANAINHFSFFYHKYTRWIFRFIEILLEKMVPNKWNHKTKEKIAKKVKLWCGIRYHLSNQKTSKLIELDLSKYGYF